MWKIGRQRTKKSFHLGKIGAIYQGRKEILDLIFIVSKLWLHLNFHFNFGILR